MKDLYSEQAQPVQLKKQIITKKANNQYIVLAEENAIYGK